MKDEILEVLNNKRDIMTKQMLYGMSVDYKELLFQVDEEIRKIIKENDEVEIIEDNEDLELIPDKEEV